MKNFRNFTKGSPEYVYYHGLSRAKFGKKPIAVLTIFKNIIDKNESFKIAERLVSEKGDDSTLLGKPFLRSKIDWAEKYREHTEGPNAEIPYSPQSGVEDCNCRYCFYRCALKEHNPKGDCQLGKGGDIAKKFFGIPSDVFLPPFIEWKNLGHYCPNYLNMYAE